jgi:intergrase/recombinase
MSRVNEERLWHDAMTKTGFRITPQMLREWFCNELGSLGAQDRYIDAFCGRLPKSVLARHYSDYSPYSLREIYQKVELKVLN